MEGADFALQYCRWLLSAVGTWPGVKSSQIFNVIQTVVFWISFISIGYFITIAQTSKLFLVNGNIDKIAEILSTADLSISVSLVKIGVIRYNQDVLKKLTEQMYNDWSSIKTESQKIIMYEAAVMGRRLCTVCFILGFGTVNLYVIIRVYFIIQLEKIGERVMLFESYIPVDMLSSPAFEIICSMQGFTAYSSTIAYTAVDCYFAVLVLHLCGQLGVLKDDLTKLADSDGKNGIRLELARIAKRHVELNRYSGIIEDIFNQVFLALMMCCLIQSCMQGYSMISLITNKDEKLSILTMIFWVVFMVYTSSHLYIYCLVAETLRVRSTELFQAAYNCKWYNLNPKDAYDISFIMIRAQYPLEITAGKFCALSLNLFASIAKTSLGYLSVLLAMKDTSETQ